MNRGKEEHERDLNTTPLKDCLTLYTQANLSPPNIEPSVIIVDAVPQGIVHKRKRGEYLLPFHDGAGNENDR